MKTITQELLDGLKNADYIKAFLDLHEQDFLSQSLIDYLNELMNEKNITVAQVAKNSGIGEYVYKILISTFLCRICKNVRFPFWKLTFLSTV